MMVCGKNEFLSGRVIFDLRWMNHPKVCESELFMTVVASYIKAHTYNSKPYTTYTVRMK